MRNLLIVLTLVAVGLAVVGCQEGLAKEEKPCAAAPAAAAPTADAPAEAKHLGPYEFTTNWMDEQGFITNWLIVGPFPNPGERPDNEGYDKDYLGGEATYTPAAGMESKKPDGTAAKWTQYAATDEKIDFFAVESLGLEYGQEDVLAYAACWLAADNDVEAELRIGSDDGYKLWLNGQLVGAEHVYRSCKVDQEVYPVKLKKGMNALLLKVDQDWGEFEFILRLVTADGETVPGVKIWN